MVECNGSSGGFPGGADFFVRGQKIMDIMRKMLHIFICMCLFPLVAHAADYDYRKILAEVGSRSGASSEDKRLWLSQLDKAAGVSAEATREMFREAAVEFNVPQVLLEAIGYLENNWIQIGPSVDRGWGVMHLVDNDYCHTLNEAAELLGVEPQVLKDDPKQNIRGAAALLSSYAKDILAISDSPDGGAGAGAYALEEWFGAASKFSGLRTRELRDMQARNYFSIIDKGVVEKNVFNHMVTIEPVSVDLGRIGPAASDIFARSPEYPEALSNMTPYNHSAGRRGQNVDTIVEHWMGVGTYAGAISWFHDTRAEASAHFCIRHDDGEVTQVVDHGAQVVDDPSGGRMVGAVGRFVDGEGALVGGAGGGQVAQVLEHTA